MGCILAPAQLAAQGGGSGRAGSTGPLVVVDVAQAPLGPFTSGGAASVVAGGGNAAGPGSAPALTVVDGALEAVDHLGQRMLRASSRTTLLLSLPAALPPDFSVEIDLVPKECCQPEDVAIEGTRTISQGQSAVSANILWRSADLRVIGGDLTTFDQPMPPDLAAALPGALTNVVFSFRGDELTVYTNGRLLHTLPNRKFVRGRVLRVFLGGQNDTDRAVYLAGLQVTAGAWTPALVATGAGAAGAGTAGTTPTVATAGATAPPGSGSTPPAPPSPGSSRLPGLPGNTGPVPTFVANVTVTPGPNGPIVSWQPPATPAVYTIQRWKSDDPACCSATSPAAPAITAPPWQDAPLPLPGTYVYQVTATTNSGSSSAQAQFQHLTSGGGTVVAQPGAISSGSRTATPMPTTPSVTAPPAAPAGGLPSGFQASVTLGANGPVVDWTTVPQATGYAVTRAKFDDATCCNTASGSLGSATSPWQDQPLPMSGTYVYTVSAATPAGVLSTQVQFGFRMPLGGGTTAPVTGVPVPSTGTATPITQPTTTPTAPTAPSRTGTPTVMSNGPVPTLSISGGTPTVAVIWWSAAPGAARYVLQRALAGTSTWTTLADLTYPPMPATLDVLPDHRPTWTYQVIAYQPDGSYGTAVADYKSPPPRDPTGFTATPTGPGEVRFDWDNVIDATFLISGPGTGTGISAAVPTRDPAARGTYTLTGVPVGTHTWSIASTYDPGGVLTPSSAWPTASATVAGAPVGPKYRLVALGFRADQQSTDVNDARDGHGDEVYFTALVNRTTLTGLPLPVVREPNVSVVMTKSVGDEAVSVPYGRFRGGTASATGGIRSGDAIPANLDPTAPTPALQGNQFPLLLWEGYLDDDDVVVVHPALWEDDVNPVVQALWAELIYQEIGGSYSPQADARSTSGYVIDERTYVTYKAISALVARPQIFDGGWEYSSWRVPWNAGSLLFQCTTVLGILVRRPCEAHGVDRPLGLRGGSHPGMWHDPVIVLSKRGAERSLDSILVQRTDPEPLGAGTFVLSLSDDVGTPSEMVARYRLYFRLERVP